MRFILSLLILLCPTVFAAELTLELPAGTRTLSSAELLGNAQARNIEIKDDVAYKRTMHYRAVPLAALLEGVDGRAHVQAVALDGFAAELPAAPLLQKDGARAWLGRVGYDPVYGARPLKRAVQKYLQDPLAEAILRGEIPDGSTVRVEEGDGALVLGTGEGPIASRAA